GSGLVEAVVEVVEQRAVETEAGTEGGVAVAEDVPGETDAGLGEEPGAVGGEGGGADGGVGVDDGRLAKDSGGEAVVRGAALRFIEAVGGFDAEAGAEFEARGDVDGVFEVACAHGGTPTQLGGSGNDGEGFHGAFEEG